MIRRPPRSTLDRSSAASDVYKRQLHHGGGVGMGYSQHAGMVIVADGTDEASSKLSRVLTYDPGMGIIRHSDAGYQRAIDNAKKHNIIIPMMK